jgi:hypothetical protein
MKKRALMIFSARAGPGLFGAEAFVGTAAFFRRRNSACSVS